MEGGEENERQSAHAEVPVRTVIAERAQPEIEPVLDAGAGDIIELKEARGGTGRRDRNAPHTGSNEPPDSPEEANEETDTFSEEGEEACEQRRDKSPDNDAGDSQEADSAAREGDQLPSVDENASREESTFNVSRGEHCETGDDSSLGQTSFQRNDARGGNAAGGQTTAPANNSGKVRGSGGGAKTRDPQPEGKDTTTSRNRSPRHWQSAKVMPTNRAGGIHSKKQQSTVGRASPRAAKASVAEEARRQRSAVSKDAVERQSSAKGTNSDVVDETLDTMAWSEAGPKGQSEDGDVLAQMDAHEESTANSAQHRGRLHSHRAKVWYNAIRTNTYGNPLGVPD